jgi:hypothetical protein
MSGYKDTVFEHHFNRIFCKPFVLKNSKVHGIKNRSYKTKQQLNREDRIKHNEDRRR